MNNNNDNLIFEMLEYFKGDPKRAQHFLKVYQFASLIGRNEKLDDKTQFILETASIVHDIGIKPAEEKYSSSSGKLQEQEGPKPANEMLKKLGYDDEIIRRVCFLVGHHHTYSDIDGADYQILVESDFLVNFYEDDTGKSAIQAAYDKIFKTETGKQLCKTMFLNEN